MRSGLKIKGQRGHMNFKATVFFIQILFFSLSLKVAAASHDITLTADQCGSFVYFTLGNQSEKTIKPMHDFSHWQNMYLVVIHEKGYGKTIDSEGVFGGDPAVGYYEIPSKNRITEKVDLLAYYPNLNSLSGSAILFWSTDVDIKSGKKIKPIRFSGSIRFNLPLKHCGNGNVDPFRDKK